MCLDELHYLDARVYGTDEEDVGEYDEDTDVDSQHDRGAAGENTETFRPITTNPFSLVQTNSGSVCLFQMVHFISYK